jgi:hypothetical protein
MITTDSIKDYLESMYGNDLYKEMVNTDQGKIIFAARELLKDNFKAESITDRAVSLQVLYMLESEASDFGSLKSQGVTSYSVKGVSISFKDGTTGYDDSGLIAPAVLKLLQPIPKAKVGRLI